MNFDLNDESKNLVRIEFINVPEDKDVIYHFFLPRNAITLFRKNRNYKIYKKYKIAVDPARDGAGQQHIHIYVGDNNEYVAINLDGSRHHRRGKPVVLPKKLFDWLVKNFPDFGFPVDRTIKLSEEHINSTMIMTVDLSSRKLIDHEGYYTEIFSD